MPVAPPARSQSMIHPFKEKKPDIDASALVMESAQVIGDVVIGEESSVWFNAVIRGDVNHIRIGKYTNIQDLSLLHVDRGQPCLIGDYVTAGHKVCLHGCVIGDEVVVGMGSVVLSGSRIESRVILGAGSLVPEGKTLESGYLYFGSPVKKIRPLTEAEIEGNKAWAERYAELAEKHSQGIYGRIGLTA